MAQRFSLRFLFMTAAVAWCCMLAAGWYMLTAYQNKPGPAGDLLEAWPSDQTVGLASDRPTLLMWAHPRCPCTRASIGELAVLMSRLQGRLRADVFFYKPEDVPDAWAQTDLWRSAKSVPGVTVHIDENGAEAARFGALVSGQVALYSPQGRLLFAGGITGARGHAGDNHGRQAVIDWVKEGGAARSETFVFGCVLRHNTLQTTTL